METRKHNGRDISLLGFGMMRLPVIDGDSSKIDYDLAMEMIDTAYKSGVNYFDTAWPYHQTQSEPFAAKALARYPRDSFHLASKLPTWLINSKQDVEDYFNKQLERCGVEYFDFYLIHTLDEDLWPKVAQFDIIAQLMEKKKQGLIKNLGFSFHSTPALMREIVAAHKWDFAQIQLNYLDWEFQDAKTLYQILADNSIPTVVMEPIRGGALVTLCPEAAAILQKADPKASNASWALRYVASLPNVLTVLSGMSLPQHVADNVKTMTGFKPLSDAERQVVADAVEAYRKAGAIPCTGCRYCMDCPAGVDIPRVFGIYNDYKTRQAPGTFLGNYQLMGEEKQASSCVECGNCVKLCPQGINIPAQLKLVEEAARQIEEERKKK